MTMEQFDYEKTSGGVRITGFHGDSVRVVIPEQIGGVPVCAIGTHAFYEEGLFVESITVPSTVRVIEPAAFELCFSLTELILHEGLEEIGRDALLATGLESVRIPASVHVIDGIADLTCTLTFADAKGGDSGFQCDGFGIYHERQLAGANAAETPAYYEIQDGTTSIAPGVFAECGALEELVIPASLTELPEGVLINAQDPFSLQKGICRIRVSEENPALFTDRGMLLRRSLKEPAYSPGESGDDSPPRQAEASLDLIRYFGSSEEPEIPETVRRISDCAFFKSGIRKIAIPKSVQEIGKDAFLENPLEEVFFPADKTDADASWKQVYFPQSDSFLLKTLLQGFGQNGRLYDFTAYDAVLEEKHLNLDRVRMICSRLENGIRLPKGRHAVLWASLYGRMEEVIPMIAEKNEIALLERLNRQGFLTERNIDRLIRFAAGSENKETMAWLMNEKNARMRRKSFDFSL